MSLFDLDFRSGLSGSNGAAGFRGKLACLFLPPNLNYPFSSSGRCLPPEANFAKPIDYNGRHGTIESSVGLSSGANGVSVDPKKSTRYFSLVAEVIASLPSILSQPESVYLSPTYMRASRQSGLYRLSHRRYLLLVTELARNFPRCVSC